MGLIAQCDGGCGATTDDIKKFKPFGTIKKVWYCDECKGALQATYDQRDLLHTRYAKELEVALLGAVSAFVNFMPKARLPDAPE